MGPHALVSQNIAIAVIALLAAVATITSIYLRTQRIRLRTLTKSDQYLDYIDDLIVDASDARRRLRRSARASRRINSALALIEIVGGGYFAIASGLAAALVSPGTSAPNSGQPDQTQLLLNVAVGFAIVVASGIRNSFHFYSSSVE